MNAKTNEYRVDIASEWRNVLKTPANLHLLSTQLSVLCAMAEADATARAQAAEADARECRAERDDTRSALKIALAERDTARETHQALVAERAHYGDIMTERLAAAEATIDALHVLSSEVHRYDETALRLDVCQDERDALRDEYRLLVERVKAVMPYAVNTASWVTLLATIGVEPEDMHFSK